MRHIETADELKSWRLQGATWHALELSDQRAVVELCTCFGEAVDRVMTETPEVIEFVRAHQHDD